MTPARATEAVALSAKRNFMMGVQPTKRNRNRRKKERKKKDRNTTRVSSGGSVGFCRLPGTGAGFGARLIKAQSRALGRVAKPILDPALTVSRLLLIGSHAKYVMGMF